MDDISITVMSPLGNFRARCTYTDADAILTIVVTQRLPADGFDIYKPIGTITLDGAPYHVLRDRVHGLVNRLEMEL